MIYVNFKPVPPFFRKDLKPPQRVPEYQQFVDATGIDWERDLDEVAIALHRMPDPNGPNGPVAYSMVLVGKLTGKGSTPGSTPTPPRAKPTPATPSTTSPPRTAPSAWRRSATTCSPSPTRPHPSRSTPSSTAIAPPRCLSPARRCWPSHYRDVPLLSLAWGIGQIGLPFSESGAISIFGLSLPLQSDSTIIASVRPPSRCRLAPPAHRRDRPQRGESRQPGRRPSPPSSPWPAASPAARRQPCQQRPQGTAQNRRSDAETGPRHRHRTSCHRLSALARPRSLSQPEAPLRPSSRHPRPRCSLVSQLPMRLIKQRPQLFCLPSSTQSTCPTSLHSFNQSAVDSHC